MTDVEKIKEDFAVEQAVFDTSRYQLGSQGAEAVSSAARYGGAALRFLGRCLHKQTRLISTFFICREYGMEPS
jgi:hypothetical protein